MTDTLPKTIPLDFHFTRLTLSEIQPTLQQHAQTLSSPIDSFLEDHILTSNHYHIRLDQIIIGWTAIHQGSLMTQFGLFPQHKRYGQPAFQRARKLETVQAAFVPTCDEFFLAHALDDYRQLEKQAYFFQRDPQAPRYQAPFPLLHRQAQARDIPTIQSLSGTFFDKIDQRIQDGQLYLSHRDGECVGFGIIDRSVLLTGVASIGMYTVESFRGLGIGTAVITFLMDVCAQQGLQAIAGCWYYNHLSKKTLEKAGLFTQTRLLKVSY
jgi:RimJ/RimL family protein N-acetyltransferase